MTDIAIPDQQPTPGVDLELWARQATGAAIYAERVCSTTMAPAAYRGKPAEATAAILAGAELGFSPMASLRAFDNIQGTPAPKALTLRAVVQAAGHEVVTVEQTPTRAVVKGRRRGDTDRRRPANHHRPDRLGNLGRGPASHVELLGRKLALVDHHDGVVLPIYCGKHVRKDSAVDGRTKALRYPILAGLKSCAT